QLGGMAGESDPALLQAVDLFRRMERLDDILLDNDEGNRFGDDLRQAGIEVAHHDRRKAKAELIAQQQAWVRHQRAADRRHLLLAAGERRAGQMPALGERGKQLVDAREAPWSGTAKLTADAEIFL